MTNAEAAIIVKAFIAAYPSTRVPDETAELWVHALGGVAHGPALKAMEDWIRNETFFPTVAGFNEVLYRHRTAEQRELPEAQDFGKWVPVGEGRKIMAKAYADECRKQNREPTPRMLERIAHFPESFPVGEE